MNANAQQWDEACSDEDWENNLDEKTNACLEGQGWTEIKDKRWVEGHVKGSDGLLTPL